MESCSKKILYVEDNVDTAEVVQIIIKTLGCAVDLAYTGHQGLEKIKKNKYDLVIFDVMLPDISGIELFDLARTDKKQDGTKYAFLTITYLTNDQKKELKEHGASDFIPKPFGKDELIRRVKAILQ